MVMGEKLWQLLAEDKVLNKGKKNPKAEEPEDPLVAASARLKKHKAERVASAEVDFGLTEMEEAASKMQEEIAERRRRIAAGEPPPPKREDKPSSRESLIALSMALLNNGVDPAIVGQILAGQSANEAIRNPQITLGGGVPDWMGKIVADAISSKDDVKIARVESEMKRLEDKLGTALTATAEAIKNIGKAEPVDPVTIATRQAEAIAATFNALKVIGLIPERAPQVSNPDLAYKIQDREWEHDERLRFIEAEGRKAESNANLELRKLQQRQDTLGQIPQMIGSALAKGIEDGVLQRKSSGSQGQAGAPRRGKRPVIEIEEGAGVETVTCSCGSPISVMPGIKQAICAGCGLKYPVATIPKAPASMGEPPPVVEDTEEAGEA